MLSIGIVGGDGGYYIELAKEDYYFAGGEPVGLWIGRGAFDLGLFGIVEREAFHYVLLGYSPDGTTALVKNAGLVIGEKSRQCAWDLTFSPCKSVSVIWSQADPTIRQIIQECQFEAVKKAISYLESAHAYTRRGVGGTDHERVGLVVAAFEHGTSRAQDPQPHTHCIVVNLATREDGTTGTIESKPLYRAKMAAGAIYRAELAKQLEDRLSLTIERKRSWFEVKGVSETLMDEFSTRREEILEAMKSRGVESAEAAAVAALDTREVKGHVARELLFKEWRQVGHEHGFTTEHVQTLCSHKRLERDFERESAVALSSAVTTITSQQSHFSERELVRHVAEEAQGRGLGASDVLSISNDYLQHSGELVRLGSINREKRFTTREMIEIEARMLARVEASKSNGTHKLSERTVTGVTASSSELNDEQRAALRHITQNSGSIQVVSGMAGTGKTRMLDAARLAWTLEGFEVHGAALSGKAARGLEEGTRIASGTLHRTLKDIESGAMRITDRTIIVLDEAGMVGTRQMAELVEMVQRGGGKLVLVGDARQLQPIDAGGPFKAIAERIGDAKLTTIMRQRADWARSSVTAFAEGRATEALRAYAERGLVSVVDDRKAAIAKLVSDWKQSGMSNPGDNLMLSATRLEVCIMNRLAQEERKQAGLLSEASMKVGNERIHEGDRILFTRNNKSLQVQNGTLARVTEVDQLRGRLSAVLDDGKRVQIPLESYDHIQLGYAVTTHKAQGATVENAFILVGGAMQDRELTYVQASRARGETRFYTDRWEAGENLADLCREMNKSHQKDLAHDVKREDHDLYVRQELSLSI